MNQRDILEYYSRDDIAQAMLSSARGREVTGVFSNGSFGQRPNIIVYKSDITSLARAGVIEFHCSIERWSQPMSLKSENYSEYRTGWDMIFDLDCRRVEHGKIAAEAFLWGLRQHGIRNASIKFTGGTGFHIGVPWESIPKKIDFIPSQNLYPSLARQVCFYMKNYVKDHFESLLLKSYSPSALAKEAGADIDRIVTDTGIDPYKIVEVDPVLISPRHLFRMPYSLNMKTFLASLPIEPESLKGFTPEHARPEKISAGKGFLSYGEENEAAALITEAIDWHSKQKKRERAYEQRERIAYSRKVEERMFPPCIKLISQGLSDGRRRSLFILLNFLKSVKWGQQDIEKFLESWNSRNSPPLPDSYLRSQIRYHMAKKQVPPPNCLNELYYPGLGVCRPDHTCTGGTGKIIIKNPVNYPFILMKPSGRRKTYKQA